MSAVLAAWKLKIAPWLWALKLAGVAAVFLFGLGTGCHWQRSRDADKIAHKDAIIAARNAEVAAAASVLEGINTATAEAVRQADAAASANAKLAEAAEARAEKLQGIIDSRGAEVERAKRNSPECRRQLELPSCAALH